MTDTSKAVTRFEPDFFGRIMVRSGPGRYVTYEDYAALSAQLAEADRLIGIKTDWINATINDMAKQDTQLKEPKP